ncbi:amino acid ABC transporter permease [Achromobacter ruhlandii]|uniref:Amino acid ABC transporter permease n=1 Tax=Achromobacter ruhlandii TaxID=72557 RepID=A0A848NGQ2_9BURK|nr:amino acid ABC transporter permease [Achromobacter ruhlandii]NMU90090.1 amino acid ABC transporter permease [Achromobacter ruhlandii]
MANELVLNGAAAHRAGGGWRALLRDPWVVLLLALVALGVAWALTDSAPAAVRHLWHWSPALLRGLGMNVQISVLAMALGTAVGLVVGALSLSPSPLLRRLTRIYVLAFRNAPILVLVYFTTYVFPFELNLGGWNLPFPDWIKVVIGLGLPASANVAEIFRGAIQSIPEAQWEAAQSLAFRRAQIFRMIVLPQCVRRMLPSWMNLYASITMSTSLASLVGVHDLVDTATVASNTVARSDFTILVYFTLLALFFAYCYPIARWTRHLERRYAHH